MAAALRGAAATAIRAMSRAAAATAHGSTQAEDARRLFSRTLVREIGFGIKDLLSVQPFSDDSVITRLRSMAPVRFFRR
jgi:hypothetical protein